MHTNALIPLEYKKPHQKSLHIALYYGAAASAAVIFVVV